MKPMLYLTLFTTRPYQSSGEKLEQKGSALSGRMPANRAPVRTPRPASISTECQTHGIINSHYLQALALLFPSPPWVSERWVIISAAAKSVVHDTYHYDPQKLPA